MKEHYYGYLNWFSTKKWNYLVYLAAYRGEEMYAKKILMRDADIILSTLASSYHPVMQEFFQGRLLNNFYWGGRNSDGKSY